MVFSAVVDSLQTGAFSSLRVTANLAVLLSLSCFVEAAL
jgi:hypothetical protein